MELLLSELSTQIRHLFGSRHGTMAEFCALIFILAVMEIRAGVDQMKAQSHGGEVAMSKPIQKGLPQLHQYILTLNQKHNYHHRHGGRM